jgi:hypothetical protein
MQTTDACMTYQLSLAGYIKSRGRHPLWYDCHSGFSKEEKDTYSHLWWQCASTRTLISNPNLPCGGKNEYEARGLAQVLGDGHENGNIDNGSSCESVYRDLYNNKYSRDNLAPISSVL